MNILLAEDNAIVRKAVASGLVADGYDVELAEDGEQALSIAKAIHPDLIISDVLMPNMDGFSLCQAVRADEKLQDIPVVFYSATFLEPEDEALSRLVGASGFILKDSDPETFRSELRAVIESSKAQNPPPFDSDPEVLNYEDRLHHQALIAKLLNKVKELDTEKKALHENRQFLSHIMNTIPDVVFVIRLPEQEITYLAPQVERLLGYSNDELMGDRHNWQPIVDDFDLERVEHEVGQAVEQGRDIIFTCRMRHKQGDIRWIEGRVSPRLNTTGETIEIFGALTDVTERFEQEEQLRQNESRLETLMNNLPGMAYRRENRRAWNMEFVSDGAELLTGYSREELENSRVMNYADLIHPQDQALVWDEVQEALDNGRQFSFVYRILHRDGSTRWVWERGVGVEGEGNFIEGFVSDITLRKQAEEKLEKSEQRIRGVFDAMASGLALYELVYDQDGKAIDYRFLEVNPAFERMSGFAAETALGHTIREVMPDIDKQWVKDYIHIGQGGPSESFFRYYPATDHTYKEVVYQTQMGQFAAIVTDVGE